jgi:hypothetical protein
LRTTEGRHVGFFGRVEVSREDASRARTHIGTEDAPRYPLLAAEAEEAEQASLFAGEPQRA